MNTAFQSKRVFTPRRRAARWVLDLRRAVMKRYRFAV
jgi:hypothetical protein